MIEYFANQYKQSAFIKDFFKYDKTQSKVCQNIASYMGRYNQRQPMANSWMQILDMKYLR